MVTAVGKQKEFTEALKELLELEYDAKEAYIAAVNRLNKPEFKEKISQFLGDHKRHIQELSDLLHLKNIAPPSGPSAKQWITKGKVIIANLISDKAILSAMHSNETDTNKAYENICAHPDKWPEADKMLLKAHEDEKKHKKWLSQEF